MSLLRTSRWLVAVALIACAVLAGWAVHRARRPATTSPAASSPRNLLEGVVARDAIGPALADLHWNDIGATVAGTSARSGLRRDVIEALSSDPRVEARYVRALLMIAEQRPEEALMTFASIPVEQIPTLHLYAPYRLHGTVRPRSSNPYREPLVAARREGKLPPLIAARVAMAEGDLRAAVQGYVASDPGQWTSYDLNAFHALLLHAGLAPDARTMLAAAVRGGRVPAGVRGAVEQLLSSGRREAAPDQLRARLTELLAENPAAREVAVAVAAEQLRVRRLFVGREYAALVREHRATDLTSLPDATLVVVLVSASRTGDIDLRDRCTQELRRRYSGPELDRWLAAVRSRQS